MKVKDLIKELQKLDKEMEILVASDEKGNNINSLRKVNIEKMHEFDGEYEYIDDDEEYFDEEAKDCLILWP